MSESGASSECQSTSGPARKECSGQDRNPTARHKQQIQRGFDESNDLNCELRVSNHPDRKIRSALDRKKTAGLDRKSPSGPMGISSVRRTSQESSSSSGVGGMECERTMRRTERESSTLDMANEHLAASLLTSTGTTILDWARSRSVRRRRPDGAIGDPEYGVVNQWAQILDEFGPSALYQMGGSQIAFEPMK